MPEIRLSNLSTGGCISVFYYRNPRLALSRRLFFPFFVQHRAISGIFYISFTNCSPHRPGNPVSFEHKEAASRKHPRRANSDLSNRLRFSISPLSFSLISLTETQPVIWPAAFLRICIQTPAGVPAGVLGFPIIPPSLRVQRRW